MGMKRISKPTWQKNLRAAWKNLQKTKPIQRIAILGVGQELDGDDAAGILAIRKLASITVPKIEIKIIEAGSAPENFTGALERFQPDFLLIIDAVQMNEKPGTIAWIDPSDISGYGGSTHSLPLNLFIDYMIQSCGCELGLIGIQPGTTAFGSPVSQPIENAVEQIVGEITDIFSKA